MKNYFTCIVIALLIIPFDIQAQNLDFKWAKRLGSKSGDSSYAIAVDTDGNAYSTGSFSLTADFNPGQDSFQLISEGQRDVYISKLDKEGNFVWADQISGKFSESAYAIALDPSGYVYITGAFRDTVDFDPTSQESFLNGRDKSEVYLAKYDFDGKFIWAHKVTSSLDTITGNVAYGLCVDPFGDVLVFGRFGSSTDFNPGIEEEIVTASGDDDIFISRYDANGNYSWVKIISGVDELEPYAIASDAQGNIYCTGNFTREVDFDPGPLTHILTAQDINNDAYILKLNSSGEFMWVHQISGLSTEYGNSISVLPNGNSYTCGSFGGVADFNYGKDPVFLFADSVVTGTTDAYILALDADGNFRWVKRITGEGDAEAFGIAASPGSSEGVYVVGFFYNNLYVDDMEIPPLSSDNSSSDVFFSRLGHDGHFTFLGSIGGPVFDFSQGIAVNVTNGTPNIYSTGFFSGTADFDPGFNEFPMTSGGSSDIYVLKLEDFVSGIKDISQEKGLNFEINPNPVNEELEIRIPSYQSVKISILNSLGRTIQSFESDVENETVRLDVSSIPSGIYFLQLKINNQVGTSKFIIVH